jgi:Tol biopolymer transport system component
MNRVMSVTVTAAVFLIAAEGHPLGFLASRAVAASQLEPGVIVFTKLSEDQTQDENVVAEIYIMTPDGLNQRRITTNAHFDIGAELSPDGSTVAFHQGHDDHCCTIQLVDIDGANERTLVTGLWPSWSPDGRRITFNAPGVGGMGDIWTIRADGTGLTNLTDTASGEARPDWSPDGQKIAFQSNRSGNTDIWIMDADGSNVGPATNNTFSEQAPEWSPSGQQILFQSNRDDPKFEVYVIDAHGVEQGLKRLTTSPGRDVDPNWSPDGQRVVFDSDRNYIVEQIRQIFIMNADGTNEIPITFPPHEDGHASWSHGPLSALARSIPRAEGGAGSATVSVTAPLVAQLGLARPLSAWSVTALGRHRTLERITGLKSPATE